MSGKRRKKRPGIPPTKGWPKKVGWLTSVALPTLLTYYAMRPKISVIPNVTLNSSDPYSTAFTVANGGDFLAAIDLRAACSGSMTEKITASGQHTVLPKVKSGITYWPRLDAGQFFTVPCIGGLELQPDIPTKITNLQITTDVTYRISWLPFRQHYRQAYALAEGDDRQLHWLPTQP